MKHSKKEKLAAYSMSIGMAIMILLCESYPIIGVGIFALMSSPCIYYSNK